MGKKQIVITLEENGEMKAETEGFTGHACMEELESIFEDENIVIDKKKKPEYFTDKNVVKRTNKLSGC